MKFKELFHAFKWDRKDGNANHLICKKISVLITLFNFFLKNSLF